MSTACFFGRDLNEDALRIIGENGVRDAEVFFSTEREYHPEYTHKLRRICEDTGVRIRSVHAFSTGFEPQLVSIHPRQQEEAIRTFHEVVAAAERLGAGIYVFHGPMYLKTARKLSIDYATFGGRMSMLAEIARDYGVKLCYETVHWCWYQRPDFAPELLDHVTSDNLFFTLDMKQVAQSGYEPGQYLDLMRGRLAHVHLCDYEESPERGVAPELPFRGQAPWTELRSHLKALDFDGCLMLEVYARNYRDVDELMDCYRRVRDFFA